KPGNHPNKRSSPGGPTQNFATDYFQEACFLTEKVIKALWVTTSLRAATSRARSKRLKIWLVV
ncbi:MAG: hypothetical protein WCF65_08930, partial [Parachlamydiaceae bacterium]